MNTSWLANHVDTRSTHAVSVIMNVDQVIDTRGLVNLLVNLDCDVKNVGAQVFSRRARERKVLVDTGR